MTLARANGIDIECETFGSPEDPALLLIMGLAAQLTLWPDALCEKLSARGFHVVRFDNRDVGLSAKFEAAGIPDLGEIMMKHVAGEDSGVPYKADDMVADSFGVLDALGIEQAHVAGFSMGGMIAQRMAATGEGRVLSLTSMSSSSGDPSLPPGDPAVMTLLAGPPPQSEDLEVQVEHARTMWRAWRVLVRAKAWRRAMRNSGKRRARGSSAGSIPKGLRGRWQP